MHETASRVGRQFREHVLFDRLLARDGAKVRSQAGPGASLALMALPTSYHTQIPAHLFRCDSAATSVSLYLSRCTCSLGFWGEGNLRRICREVGGRVRTNVLVRDMDLAVLDVSDDDRLEVVVASHC